MAGVILDPKTLRSATKREIVFGDPKIATFASQADVVFRILELGVVCATCGEPPVMGNAPQDALWKMECACAVRLLKPPRN